MIKYTLKILFTMLFISVISTSCKKDVVDSEKRYIKGVIETNIPNFAIINQKIEVKATGITEPTENIKYKWRASGFEIADSLGAKISFTTPSAFGTYTIFLTVSSEGYPSRSYSRDIVVLDPALQKSLKGVKFPQSKITDSRDGNIYHFSTIGNLDWFAANLNHAGAGKAYNDMEPLSYFYGRLYTWKELSTAGKSICPEGWRVPSNSDWEELAKNLNNGKSLSFNDKWVGLGEMVAVKAYLNEKEVWAFSPENIPANKFLWNALPGGNAQYNFSQFAKITEYGMWWSSTEKDSDYAYFRYIYYDSPDFPYLYADKENMAMSVRCVRDKI